MGKVEGQETGCCHGQLLSNLQVHVLAVETDTLAAGLDQLGLALSLLLVLLVLLHDVIGQEGQALHGRQLEKDPDGEPE